MKKILIPFFCLFLLGGCSKDENNSTPATPSASIVGAWDLSQKSVNGSVVSITACQSQFEGLYFYENSTLGQLRYGRTSGGSCHMITADVNYSISGSVLEIVLIDNSYFYVYDIIQLTNDSLILKSTAFKYYVNGSLFTETIPENQRTAYTYARF